MKVLISFLLALAPALGMAKSITCSAGNGTLVLKEAANSDDLSVDYFDSTHKKVLSATAAHVVENSSAAVFEVRSVNWLLEINDLRTEKKQLAGLLDIQDSDAGSKSSKFHLRCVRH